MKRLRIINQIALTEYLCWIKSSKVIILLIMLVFAKIQIIDPLQNCASIMGHKLSLFEPYIALGNSGVVVLIVPMLFLVLLSDYPHDNEINIFYQIRCGKTSWIIGEILFAFFATGTIVLFLLTGTLVFSLPFGEWSLKYSYAITHFVSRFPERRGDYVVELLPENLYNQVPLDDALFHTVLLMVYYFLVLAFNLMIFHLLKKKYIGIIINVLLIVVGAITCAIRTRIMWLFPMAHTIVWLHFKEYIAAEEFSLLGSYIYFVLILVVQILLCFCLKGFYQLGRR